MSEKQQAEQRTKEIFAKFPAFAHFTHDENWQKLVATYVTSNVTIEQWASEILNPLLETIYMLINALEKYREDNPSEDHLKKILAEQATRTEK